jgi:hypothetical protein
LAENEEACEMRIVLTNDDGIDAPGLLAARQALEKIGDVLTVAPDRNRSGVGRSITFGTALHVEEIEMADGVRLAARGGDGCRRGRVIAVHCRRERVSGQLVGVIVVFTRAEEPTHRRPDHLGIVPGDPDGPLRKDGDGREPGGGDGAA